MNYPNVVNIFGISLEIVGVLLLANSDLLAKRIAAAFEKIPETCLDLYYAAKEGREPDVSPEKVRYHELAKKQDGQKALDCFKCSLGLIVAGMGLQLVAAIWSL